MPPTDWSAPADRARLAVLDALAHTPELWRAYVLKGGLALHFAYGSPRRSSDLDFSAVEPFSSEITEANERRILRFCHTLDAGLEAVAARHGLAGLAVQRRTLSDEIPALLAEVGYSAEARAENRYDDAIEMQVVLSEVVCETAESHIEGVPIHVPSLDDVLAEKLKALLQQVPRDTARSTDVFDLWYFLEISEHPVDRAKVADFVRQKSTPWPAIQPLARSEFADERVRAHAASAYDGIAASLGDGLALPPFDEAFGAVLRFVRSLDLPA
jgi:predicted nucleotidyltransferase component of viral defense system